MGIEIEPYDIVGFAGAAIFVVVYFANQQRWLSSEDWRYPLANLIGAMLILVSLLYEWNFPSVVIEVFWAVISLYGMAKSLRERRYCIAVLREGEGSRHLHDEIRVGDIVDTSLPRNNFTLAEGAERHLLMAGGIGITPIMAMIAELKRRRADFVLHYCTRVPAKT